jgi:hypothetical protein
MSTDGQGVRPEALNIGGCGRDCTAKSLQQQRDIVVEFSSAQTRFLER